MKITPKTEKIQLAYLEKENILLLKIKRSMYELNFEKAVSFKNNLIIGIEKMMEGMNKNKKLISKAIVHRGN